MRLPLGGSGGSASEYSNVASLRSLGSERQAHLRRSQERSWESRSRFVSLYRVKDAERARRAEAQVAEHPDPRRSTSQRSLRCEEPDWAYGAIAGRRREAAVDVLRATTERLVEAGWRLIPKFKDATNVFGAVGRANKDRALLPLVPVEKTRQASLMQRVVNCTATYSDSREKTLQPRSDIFAGDHGGPRSGRGTEAHAQRNLRRGGEEHRAHGA